MANRKISQLTALTTPAAGDYLPIVDISEAAAADQNKRITIEELLRGAPDGTEAAPSIAFESDPNTGIYSPGANTVGVSTAGTERLRITTGGNVGIGVSSPTAQLDVGGGNLVTMIVGGNSAASGRTDATNKAGRIAFPHYTNAEQPVAGLVALMDSGTNIVNIGGGSSLTNAATSLQFYTASNNTTVTGTERMRIDSDGNVGIGTSSPAHRLDLVDATDGTIRVGGQNIFNSAYTTVQGVSRDANGVSGAIGFNATSAGFFNDPSHINTNFSAWSLNATGQNAANEAGATFRLNYVNPTGTVSSRILVDSSGNVGIGTTSPTSSLQVGDGTAALNWFNARGTTSDLYFGQNVGGTHIGQINGAKILSTNASYPLSIGTTTSQSFIFGTNNTERLRIDSAGRLLVGTSSSSTNDSITAQGNSGNSSGNANLRLRRGETAPTSNNTIGFVGFENSAGGLGASITAFTDANWTAGSSYPARLTFSTTADGASSPTERMRIKSTGAIRCVTAFTVSTLPTGEVGDLARVTDASSPSIGSTVAGGGAANALCWYNGSNWTVMGI